MPWSKTQLRRRRAQTFWNKLKRYIAARREGYVINPPRIRDTVDVDIIQAKELCRMEGIPWEDVFIDDPGASEFKNNDEYKKHCGRVRYANERRRVGDYKSRDERRHEHRRERRERDKEHERSSPGITEAQWVWMEAVTHDRSLEPPQLHEVVAEYRRMKENPIFAKFLETEVWTPKDMVRRAVSKIRTQGATDEKDDAPITSEKNA